MSTTSRTLAVEGLSVATWRAGTPVPIVHGIDLALATGEVLALVGRSGSGKSLTCLALQDALPPGTVRTGGRVVVDGIAVAPAAIRGRIVATVLQAPRSAFNPLRTIGDHAGETLRAAGIRGRTASAATGDALAAVGLDAAGTRELYPFQMSGGMLQRAMIALALLTGAPFLVADEPTTDLDALSQARILDLVERLVRERGLGLLIVTHDMGVMARLADRTAVMEAGRIVETGPTVRLFEAAQHPTTRALVAAHLSLYEGSA